jgi:multisubunit Na+/H+ antiporter MnhB subunit
VTGGIWALGTIGWNMYWGAKGGGVNNLNAWMIQSPFQFFTNLIGIFGSPTKGLFVFAPVLLLTIYAIPRAFRAQQEVTIFVVLVTACTMAFISTLIGTADELWGPRFMHVIVAPLLLSIGIAWPRFKWRRHAALLLLGTLGLLISFLGAFYYYGSRDWAAERSAQNTLEWFAGDNVWNEVIFDARLFGVWWRGGTEPVPWTATHIWVWSPPADAPAWKTVNLRDYADPQSFLLFFWNKSLDGNNLTILRIYLSSLFLGPVLMLWAFARTVREQSQSEIAGQTGEILVSVKDF